MPALSSSQLSVFGAKLPTSRLHSGSHTYRTAAETSHSGPTARTGNTVLISASREDVAKVFDDFWTEVVGAKGSDGGRPTEALVRIRANFIENLRKLLTQHQPEWNEDSFLVSHADILIRVASRKVLS